MANPIVVKKVAALPATLEPSVMYLVPNATAGLMDLFVSDAQGLTVKHIISRDDIVQLITNAIGGFNTVKIVADIAARNALSLTTIQQVLVLDATGDPTVKTGAATYIYDPATTLWYKISEYESLDITTRWSDVVDRPTSLVADIDDAVSKRHVHDNKAVIDLLSKDANNNLMYDGKMVAPLYSSEEW